MVARAMQHLLESLFRSACLKSRIRQEKQQMTVGIYERTNPPLMDCKGSKCRYSPAVQDLPTVGTYSST
jgi:hypothetical protein